MRTTDPTTYKGWATMLSQMWGPRFPVDVRCIALEYSKRFADPIFKVTEADINAFEGALYPLPKKGGWAILYNPSITSAGRINYTLAHELGHYFAHRATTPAGFQCGERDVLGNAAKAALRQQEREADEFASYLLMPLDDFRLQIGTRRMSLDLLRHLADRYSVSLTAAALKWIESTDLCAAVVVATNGYVSWYRPSTAARKARVYFEFGMELPGASIAALGENAYRDDGTNLAGGIWNAMPVREIAIFADRYEMTISLLVFDHAPSVDGWDEEISEDAFDRLTRGIL